MVIALLALAAAGYAVWGQVSATSAQQAAEKQAKEVADPVAALCASDPTIYAKLSADSRARWDRACTKAAEVQQSQTPAPGPTDAQVAAAVDSWLRAHPPAPGQPATPAMVATAVAEYLTAHPPAPGRAPTGQEIAAAASAYIAAHAADFQGPTGERGANGQDATDAQVSAAVASYCAAHNNCAGPTGATGPTGPAGQDGKVGPTCPAGYELRDALITAPDGTTYRGKACVDPSSSQPPSTTMKALKPSPVR